MLPPCTALNFANPPTGGRFPSVPWLCAYCPVRNVARDGQQSGKLTKLFAKLVPNRATRPLTLLITRIDSAVWSSLITTTTLGRDFLFASAGSAAVAGSSAAAPMPAPPSPSATARTAARAGESGGRPLPAATGIAD